MSRVELPRAGGDGRLRELAQATARRPGRGGAPHPGASAGRTDPDAFWARVESNLSRDRVRIVLVTDRVPDELTRIVEFLDGQLRDVEVRAVEVSLYGSGQVSVLVPRSARPGSGASGARHVEPPPGLTALAEQAAPGTDGPGRHRLRE